MLLRPTLGLGMLRRVMVVDVGLNYGVKLLEIGVRGWLGKAM